MFRIEMLPAGNGDALWIEYGTGEARHRVLIDGGTPASYASLKARIEKLAEGDRRFELLVITHIDADHIGGALVLLEKHELGAVFDDVWFNGYGHLLDGAVEPFGAVQGERLTTALLDQKLDWNQGFGHAAACRAGDGGLVSRRLPGGLELTLLSPTREKLAKLRSVWERECQKAGLDPNTEVAPAAATSVEPMGGIDVDSLAASKFVEDQAEPNGSSIGMLAEFEGKRILLGADAHPSVLEEGIQRLLEPGEKLQLAACKLPHHGSKHNVSPDLLGKLDCRAYLVSTNGSQFHHPDREAIARVIHFGGDRVKLVFNYRSKFSEVWDDDDLRHEFGYDVSLPEAGADGAVVDL